MLQFTIEAKTTSKMGKDAQKSENFVWKLVEPKQATTKLVFILYGWKIDLYLLRTSKILTKIKLKKKSSKNHRNFLKTNTFNNIRDNR